MNHKRFRSKSYFIVSSLLIIATLACSLGGITDAPPPTPDPSKITFAVTGGERVLVNDQPIEVASLSMSASSITQGQDPVTASITLTAPAPEDMSIMVGTNGIGLILPDTVVVPAGQDNISFPITTNDNLSISISGPPTYESVAAKAYENGQQKFYSLRLNRNSIDRLNLNLNATSILANTTHNVDVVTFSPGQTLTLSSSDPNVLTVPASITTPSAPPYQVLFAVEAKSVEVDTPVTITANGANGSYRRLTLSVVANGVSSLTLPSSAVGPSSPTGTVTLAKPAPAGGAEVKLESTKPDIAAVPASLVIPEGATSANFTITALEQSSNTSGSARIYAYYNGTSSFSGVTVIPNRMKAITVEPSTLVAGQSATGTVSLEGPAKAGGVTVNLSAQGNAAIGDSFTVVFPSSVAISEGQTSATFSLQSHLSTSPNTVLTMKANYGIEKITAITIKQNSVDTLALNPSSVVGGDPINGTVTLVDVAPADTRVKVGLGQTTTTNAVTFPEEVIVPAGQKTVTFSMQTQPQTADRSVTLAAAVNWLPPGFAGTLQFKNATVQVKKQGTVLPTNTPTTAPTSTPTSTPTKTSTPAKPSATPTKSGLQVAATATKTPTTTSFANAGTLKTFTISSTRAKGGSTVFLTIGLTNGAAQQGLKVSFTSDNTLIKVPSSITIKAGSISSNTSIQLPKVTSNITANITADDGTVKKTVTITVTP